MTTPSRAALLAALIPTLFALNTTLAQTATATDGWAMKKAPLMTKWAAKVDPNAPLPEYPRPQLTREKWLNLNGLWQFQPGKESDPTPIGKNLASKILVPFPIESAISGVMEHHDRLWYRRTFEVPADWKTAKNKILLHFGAVDYEAEIFLNGKSLTTHTGGYEPFTLDITDALTASGPQELIVRVYDPTDLAGIPRGKQSIHPGGIMYTTTTGIWQTVWLEPVPAPADGGIEDVHIVPDIDNGQIRLSVKRNLNQTISKPIPTKVTIKDGDTIVQSAKWGGHGEIEIKIPNPKLWSPDSPFLYDVSVESGDDKVATYFGMRKISLGEENGIKKLFLNNKFVFQHGPLDQGFWPDGIYTAPTDEALKYDIEMTKAMGFNMIRKHIKVEPQRWYYWTDKLGILVWQDMPSINSYLDDGKYKRPPVDKEAFKKQLINTVHNLRNHPSIVMWVTFNESQGQREQDTAALVQLTRDLDPSRLVNEASGGDHHGHGDVFDIHPYPPPQIPKPNTKSQATQALANGEFGGIGFNLPGHVWGAKPDSYVMINDPLDYILLYSDFCKRLKNFRDNHGLSAAVYTEITDVENEMNGLLTYDRIPKVPIAQIALANRFEFPEPQITTIVPTSEESPQPWKYTEEKPADNTWQQKSFNDANWKQAPGGFGAKGTPNTGNIGTSWLSPDIWIRRTFDGSKITPEQLANLSIRIYHDEDAQVFINGKPAFHARGFSSNYRIAPLSPEARTSITPDANNTIAVHCHQTVGGQYIDVGLAIRTIDESKIPK